MDWRDDEIQLGILRALDKHFGKQVERQAFMNEFFLCVDPLKLQIKEIDASDPDKLNNMLNANIRYLEAHKLIEAIFLPTPAFDIVSKLRITAKGSDHLQLDGGLTTYFNKVTVRFDEDTLRAMMLKGINESDLPAREKNQAREILEKAGSGALQNITKDGLTELFKQMPNVVSFLQNLI